MRISAYTKAIVAAVGAIVTVLIAATNDGLVDSTEVGLIVTELLTTIGVFLFPNNPER